MRRFASTISEATSARLADAVADGVPVKGYFYRSLMDNFEWSLGTAPAFRPHTTDYARQAREPRPLAAYYAELCETGSPAGDETGARGARLSAGASR
jgi:beta-glucosidase/6-phospho-beta-glucosidase/beta-galactosidase